MLFFNAHNSCAITVYEKNTVNRSAERKNYFFTISSNEMMKNIYLEFSASGERVCSL
jgi:hypothetical protein